ncbi:MAG: hypothetical protein M1814_005920 [Vezdaea aestivalis]|nr:MAG: hypothetical protein M1814_005920 [Vezdaea aestivalis]
MSSQRRKPVGLAALASRSSTANTWASHGSNIRSAHMTALQTQLSVFQSLLQNFSQAHAKEIRSNPQFRAEFARMCAAIGVDPLASSNKDSERGGSWWAQVLGGEVNDFYYELAVRVVECCRRSRKLDGGLIAVDVVRERVSTKNLGAGTGQSIGEWVSSRFWTLKKCLCSFCRDDIVRAVKLLKPLGSGFALVTIGRRLMIRSVPKELNNDQSKLLEVIQVLGYVTVSMLQLNLTWERARARTAIDDLMADSLLWVDLQAEEPEYWSPTAMKSDGFSA